MQAAYANGKLTLAMEKEEALVLFEMLQRLTDEQEKLLLPLLHSSAEFAVLCRINSHLEKNLPESFSDKYDDLLLKARTSIIKHTGHYDGIEER